MSNVVRFPSLFFRRAGWVYVFGNRMMPGVFKIGFTTRSVEQRLHQLYTTGVPGPFHCVFAEWFADCRRAEAFIHERLTAYRLEQSREFFAVELSVVDVAFMEYSAIGEVIPDELVDHYHRLRKAAELTERVNGTLVARAPERRPHGLEVPF